MDGLGMNKRVRIIAGLQLASCRKTKEYQNMPLHQVCPQRKLVLDLTNPLIHNTSLSKCVAF